MTRIACGSRGIHGNETAAPAVFTSMARSSTGTATSERNDVFHELPQGELLFCVQATPKNVDGRGNFSRGWLITQLGLAGRGLSQKLSGGRTATVAIDALRCSRTVMIGAEICCYGKLEAVDRSSIVIYLEAWTHRCPLESAKAEPHLRIADGQFTYRAVDEPAS